MANNRAGDPQVSVKDTEQLMTTLWHPDIKNDPYAFVMYIYPWGQPGTPLANKKGPYKWQKEELLKIRDHLAENLRKVELGLNPTVYKCAISSGRGVGKSSFVAWVTHWMMSCIPGSSSILSANTDTQLTDKTFGELGKWLTLGLNSYWFDRSQKKIKTAVWYGELLAKQLKIDEAKYYAAGVLWNEDAPDSFAGEHSEIGVLLIFDESSGIPQPIWTVSEGFFTELTVYRFWFAFSNPRKNTGPFFECFHAHREFWNTRKVDARTVEDKDPAVYQEIIDKWGEDSDEVRIEVKGEFPAQGDRQFIPRDMAMAAATRELERYDDHAALVIGCDPARFGTDSTVIRFRRGRDARSIPPTVLKGADNMQVANKLAELIDSFDPDGVFIDAGAGAGIIDRLKERGYKTHEVGFGTESQDKRWEDHRTELWGRMKEWLPGAMLDSSSQLLDDLTGPEYEFAGRNDRLKLESKEKMKKRGLSSPDHADALALTFHARIARHDAAASRKNPGRRAQTARGMDYKIFKDGSER